MSRNSIIRHLESGDIVIHDVEERNLHHTYYYFRLGDVFRVWSDESRQFESHVVQDGVITIPSRGYGLISSHERFLFNDKVFAFVSQISDVALSGLRLNHSATIDPYYSGRLEMGIENLLDTEVSIRVGMNLGKIVFFNVAESRPLDSPDKTISQSKYRRRGQDAPDPGELIWA